MRIENDLSTNLSLNRKYTDIVGEETKSEHVTSRERKIDNTFPKSVIISTKILDNIEKEPDQKYFSVTLTMQVQ